MATDYVHDARVKVSTHLGGEAAARLRAAAEARGISVAEALREALGLWHAQEEALAPERARAEAERRWVVEGGPRPT